MAVTTPRLRAAALAPFERDGLKAAFNRLPVEGVHVRFLWLERKG